MSSGSRITGFWRQADLPTCYGTNPPAPVLTTLGNPRSSLVVPPRVPAQGSGPPQLSSALGGRGLKSSGPSSQLPGSGHSSPASPAPGVCPCTLSILSVLTCAPFSAFLVLFHLFTQFPILNAFRCAEVSVVPIFLPGS